MLFFIFSFIFSVFSNFSAYSLSLIEKIWGVTLAAGCLPVYFDRCRLEKFSKSSYALLSYSESPFLPKLRAVLILVN